MARCVAEQSIKHNGKLYSPGDDLTGLPAALVEEWIRTGYARKLTKLEPSIRDSKEEWVAFLATEGYGTEAELLEMSKNALLQLFDEGPAKE